MKLINGPEIERILIFKQDKGGKWEDRRPMCVEKSTVEDEHNFSTHHLIKKQGILWYFCLKRTFV